jgi:membrane protein insertase Oxa1/YidC/SpoIIIJ
VIAIVVIVIVTIVLLLLLLLLLLLFGMSSGECADDQPEHAKVIFAPF